MKIIIKDSKSREVFFEGTFYPVDVELEVPFSSAIRMGKYMRIEFLDKETLPYNPSLFNDKKYFGFTSDIDSVSGWGNVSFNLLKNSNQYDIGLTGRMHGIMDRDIVRMNRRELEPSGAMVWHEQPKQEWFQSPFARNIAIVPFETTKIPQSWVDRINHFEALFVPCQQNAVAFKESGVTIPIKVIHWGVDVSMWREIERPERPVFTFGTMGSLSLRKGTDLLVRAFLEAFPVEKDVRLICKTSNHHYPFMIKDKRIIVQMTPVSHEELMRDFFREIDCFVFPTRGEGWGMPPQEAMATGVPAIVTGWSGPLEYMTPDIGWLIDHTMTPATAFSKDIYKEDCGDWAEPSIEHLKQLMRYAYEHRDETKAKGKAAAREMREKWDWKDKIEMFHSALKKHL